MTDTDRTLLEKAARAAGLIPHDVSGTGLWVYPVGSSLNWDGEYPISNWNPLTDDGDALRLGHKLGLFWDSRWPSDLAEFRRAIVRAAASLGEQHDQ